MIMVTGGLLHSQAARAQVTDTLPSNADSARIMDTALRIKNLNPYFTLHVDSTLRYDLEINRDESQYYYFIRNSPVGLKIDKDNGLLTFKADKNFFLSGKLKYDNEYKILLGVQSLNNPKEHLDTVFSLLFYNTEIIPSRLKPSVNSLLSIDETETVSFKLQCENGSFPIDNITFFSNIPLKGYTLVHHCDDEFVWTPSFDFVKDTDSARTKLVVLTFIGANRFLVKDTAVVRVYVRDALNYPLVVQEYNLINHNINNYILQLKVTFLQLDKNVKNTKSTRTSFDITSSTTALTGSIMSASANPDTKKTGQVMPSVGVALVPIKEAVAPQKIFDQNQASMIRTAIKRLEYMQRDNALVGEKDPDIQKKINKLKDELKQSQIQLIDIPLEIASGLTEAELNEYFNNPKVIKKYRIKK